MQLYFPGAVTALDKSSLLGITGLSLLGFIVNEVMKRNVAVGRGDIEGCPVWSWYLGFVIQSVIYPSVIFMGFRSKNYDLHNWLQSAWADGACFWERLWFYLFAAYLIKDLPITEDALYIAHHVVCLVR